MLHPQTFPDPAPRSLEHIAIARSFGRVNNYKINASQELVAIGATNLTGPTFGAFAATGASTLP